MTERNQDFTMVKGDTRTVTIKVTDEDGNPKNLLGSTKKWEAWRSGTAQIQKASTDIDIVSVDGTNDGLRFTLEEADTETLNSGVYKHEAEVTDAVGSVSTVTQGSLWLLDQLIV